MKKKEVKENKPIIIVVEKQTSSTATMNVNPFFWLILDVFAWIFLLIGAITMFEKQNWLMFAIDVVLFLLITWRRSS